jgi:FdhD protein
MQYPDGGSVKTRFQVLRPGTDVQEFIDRGVAIEAPVAIEYNGIGYAVMMTTPIDLHDFATGFSLSEGLITDIGQIHSIDAHRIDGGIDGGWILRIQITGHGAETIYERARQRVSESSCGLCGMDNLEQVMRILPPVTATIDITNNAIFHALDILRDYQPLNTVTGGMHAAAFCDPGGDIITAREDVGRHNALDKLLGALAQSNISASSGFVLLTARCSFELVQKAVLANCPLLVTVSVATSLAIEQAQVSGLKLICLARSDSALLI